MRRHDNAASTFAVDEKVGMMKDGNSTEAGDGLVGGLLPPRVRFGCRDHARCQQ